MFGRNLFHLLLNESHNVDIDTRLVALLLTNHVDLSKEDIFGRIPIVYSFMSFKEFDTHLLGFNTDNSTKIGVQKSKQFSKKDPVEIFTILVNHKINWLSSDV